MVIRGAPSGPWAIDTSTGASCVAGDAGDVWGETDAGWGVAAGGEPGDTADGGGRLAESSDTGGGGWIDGAAGAAAT
jgi:hypothetical protein